MSPQDRGFNPETFNYFYFNPGNNEESILDPFDERRHRGVAVTSNEDMSRPTTRSGVYETQPMKGHGASPDCASDNMNHTQSTLEYGVSPHLATAEDAVRFSTPFGMSQMAAPVPCQGSAQALGEEFFDRCTVSNYHSELEGFTSIGYASNSGRLTSVPVQFPLPGSNPKPQAPVTPTNKSNYYTATGKLYAKALRIGDGTQLSDADQTIISMKGRGRGNKEIAKKLEDFGVFYNEKTVGTRHIRLLQKIHDKAEERLEEVGTSWTRKEDEALLVSYNAANLTLKERADRANAKKYLMVSKYLAAHLSQDVSYSASACAKRITELKAMLFDKGDENNEQEGDGVATSADARELTFDEAKAKLEKDIATEKINLANKEEKLERLCNLAEHLTVPNAAQSGSTCKELLASTSPQERLDKISSYRMHMLVRELEDICWDRKLPKGGAKSTLVRRLALDDADKSVKDLQKALCDANLSTTGTRRELLHRVVAFEVNSSLLKRGISQNHHDFVPAELPSSFSMFFGPQRSPTSPTKPRLRDPQNVAQLSME